MHSHGHAPKSEPEPEPPRRPVDDVMLILRGVVWILIVVGWILHGGDLPVQW